MLGLSSDTLPTCRFIGNAELAVRLKHYHNIIGGLSMFSSFLSIIGSSTIIWFSAKKGVCRYPEIRPLFHLSAADLMLSLLWFISPCIYFVNMSSIDHHAVTCFALQTTTEIIHVITFFLTINYAANVYLCMRERAMRLDDSDEPSLMMKIIRGKLDQFRPISCILAWIIPILLFVPFIAHMSPKNINSCQSCIMLIDVPHPKHISTIWKYYGYLIMVVTLTIAIFSILVLYSLTMILYRKSMPVNFLRDRERIMIHRLTQSTLKFIIVFLICWSPALTIASMDLQNASYRNIYFEPLDRYIWLYILQALTAPLQGFLNSLVYGWGRKTFRQIVLDPSYPADSGVMTSAETWPIESEAQQLFSSS